MKELKSLFSLSKFPALCTFLLCPVVEAEQKDDPAGGSLRLGYHYMPDCFTQSPLNGAGSAGILY